MDLILTKRPSAVKQRRFRIEVGPGRRPLSRLLVGELGRGGLFETAGVSMLLSARRARAPSLGVEPVGTI